MKTEKSSIKNELAEFDIEKIRRFTETELAKLADQTIPFCYQVGTDILVGRSKVVKIDDHTWRVFEGKEQIFDFLTRKHAIFYCIAVHQKQTQVAKELRESDALLNRLEFDAALFRYRYKTAESKQDDWNMELYSNKYLETMRRIEQTKKDLKKSINSAKYIKV
jgi:hypothetical protein